MNTLSKDPSSKNGNRIARGAKIAAVAASLALAACTQTHNPKQSAPTKQPAVTAPLETTTTLSPEKAANIHNAEVTQKIENTISAQMPTLPERIIAWGHKRGAQVLTYETGTPDGKAKETTDINHIRSGKEMNVLVEIPKSAGKKHPGDPQSNFLLRWTINPDNSRTMESLWFFEYDYSDPSDKDDGFRYIEGVQIDRAENSGFDVKYDIITTDENQGSSANTGPNGSPTTVDADRAIFMFNAYTTSLEK